MEPCFEDDHLDLVACTESLSADFFLVLILGAIILGTERFREHTSIPGYLNLDGSAVHSGDCIKLRDGTFHMVSTK